MSQIVYIKIEDLTQPEFDGRIELDNVADIELSESIKQLGVLEPIIVRKVNGKTEIIAGSCRYRASKIAGLDSIPCILVKANDEHAETIKLHENLKRLPLSHIDQAVTFARLISDYGMSERQICEISGKSVPYISQHICLLDSGEEIITSVQKEEINFSVARELMHVKNPKTRLHLLHYAKKGGATVDTVKNWVSEANNEEFMESQRSDGSNDSPPPSNVDYSKFVCNTCQTPSEITEMKVIRICEDCHRSIFSSIEEAKRELCSKNTP